MTAMSAMTADETRYVMWGTAATAEDWAADILLSDASLAQVLQELPLAKAQGFRNIRNYMFDNKLPDWAATVRV